MFRPLNAGRWLAARLQEVLPDESCLLYRALIVQLARRPVWAEQLDKPQKAALLRRIGFGIPDIERATTNTGHRVTFLTYQDRTLGPGDCHIYQVPIPPAMRSPADAFDIRIDVTLTYAHRPGRRACSS